MATCKHSHKIASLSLVGVNHVFESIATKDGDSHIHIVCSDCLVLDGKTIGYPTRVGSSTGGHVILDVTNPDDRKWLRTVPGAPYWNHSSTEVCVSTGAFETTAGMRRAPPRTSRIVIALEPTPQKKRAGLVADLFVLQPHDDETQFNIENVDPNACDETE